MICLILGGSGSGKSRLAESRISRLPIARRIYLATMTVPDEESRKRIVRHRAQREHLQMETIEVPMDIASAGIPEDADVLLEDLPNLVANEMFMGGDVSRILPAVRKLAGCSRNLVIVSGNVFDDGVLYDEATEAWRMQLAQLNCEITEFADVVCEAVFGIPVLWKGEWV